ncbi:MAG: transcription termination/antitermination protein NusA, partial [Actinomycetota bacterium]
MNADFLDALQVLAREKGISVDTLLDALANALVAAYKRLDTAAEEAVVTIDPDTGEIKVYGQELDEDGNVIKEWDDTPEDFGRIAAQTAKQVVLQRIREAERDMKYEEYAGREGDIVTGIIQQSDNRYTLLDLGKVEALMPQAEQVPYERYEHGSRLKAYIVEVRKTT